MVVKRYESVALVRRRSVFIVDFAAVAVAGVWVVAVELAVLLVGAFPAAAITREVELATAARLVVIIIILRLSSSSTSSSLSSSASSSSSSDSAS